MKRIIYLLVVLFVVGLIVFIAYLLRSRAPFGEVPGGELPPDQTANVPLIPLDDIAILVPAEDLSRIDPDQTSPKFGLLSREEVEDFYIEKDDTILLLRVDGTIMRVNNEQSQVLSSTGVSPIISSSFSFDGKMVLVTFGNRANLQVNVFDIEKKEWRPLPEKMQSPAWAPASHEIVYISQLSGSTGLFTLDLDVTRLQPKRVAAMALQDMFVSWSAPRRIILEEPASARVGGSIWSVDPTNGVVTLLVSAEAGATSLWNASSTGDGLVFFASERERGGNLRIVNSRGIARRTLSSVTLPSKCAFASLPIVSQNATSSTSTIQTTERIVCGIPQDQEELQRTVLPDAYLKRDFFTVDTISMINPVGGVITPIFSEPGIYLDVSKLRVMNGLLFFVNRYDHHLYVVVPPPLYSADQ